MKKKTKYRNQAVALKAVDTLFKREASQWDGELTDYFVRVLSEGPQRIRVRVQYWLGLEERQRFYEVVVVAGRAKKITQLEPA